MVEVGDGEKQESFQIKAGGRRNRRRIGEILEAAASVGS